MRQKKYTLPRHTNLASQGPRLGAFLVDMAIALAISLGLIFFCFRYVFKSKVDPLQKKMDEMRLASKLFITGEKGETTYYSTTANPDEFKNGIEYFYTHYIPYKDENADKPAKLKDGTEVDKKEYFTVEWFNKEVLQIEGGGASFFEYQKDGEEDLKDKSASIKEDASRELVNKFLQSAWAQANYDFNHLESFKKVNNEHGLYSSLEVVLGAIIGCSLTYILVPYLFKNGVTLGKKAFGLCLATSDGYTIQNHQLFMRMMPLTVVILSMLIPIWSRITVALITYMIILLVSFAISMSSPKRSSLHDLVARTIVVDARSSTLFKDSTEEEIYIAKEDGIPLEETARGEEPDIKYEKY